MAQSARTIAIVGAGFSGTALAARLLRSPPQAPTRLLLFERSETIGRGVAYAEQPFPYLLNVPAGRMSAVPEDPDDLLDYARQRLPEVHAGSYLTRACYGDYLQHHLAQSEAAAPAHVQLERVRCEVTALHLLDLKGAAVLRALGRQWLADQVVIASGDPPPLPKCYAAEVQDHPAYIVRPFASARIQPGDRRVLIIGTGPTMADMSAAAVAANPQVELIAVSRHGLLPQAQNLGAGATVLTRGCSGFEMPAGASLRQIVAGMRAYLEAVQQQGLDWRDALVALRKCIPVLWEGLGNADRCRFLRHVRAYWDIHRHRLAPEIALKIARLRASGQLRVHAGRIVRLAADESGINVHWIARGESEFQQLSVDRVFDCSGSDCRALQTRDPLLRQLLDAGIASVDPQGLGLRTGQHGALINRDGDTAQQLFYLGPMLRARHWEATAVGELRQHVESLAEALRADSSSRFASGRRLGANRFGFAESQPSR
jgi:uncharacterized NAD(P)/FAD-binding protein YdhS